ncbi:Acetyl-CoA carboxylase 1 [Camellia lanceoleosa]|uniref:Acetyl-CoA carboxylase 1 n=1 Tax=Camellia lanceoleosa TaxID=1840588 RepID=A0ACC0HVB8_9ERIC|nr:Acetyl-CoA carboxylase 1 [Camellia lanceoleosa]
MPLAMGSSQFDPNRTNDPESTRPKGHCVAVRVTNEDPDDGFKPTSEKVQASDYMDNKIHKGWLDNRIAMRVRAERPPWYLSVVGGALYKAPTSSAAMVLEYVGYLEKGKSLLRFTVSRRVVGFVGGERCSNKNEGPSNVNVELLSPTGDLVTSVLTSPTGSYSFTNIIPGKYKLHASRPDFNVEVRGSAEVEFGFENGLVDDIFFVPGYDIRGSVVAQAAPIFDML